MKRLLCLMLCFLFLAACPMANAISWDEQITPFTEDAFELKFKVSIKKWMPLDEQRSMQLSNLLQHIGINISACSSTYSMKILVDDHPCVSFFIKENDSEESLAISTTPDVTFLGSTGILSGLQMTEHEKDMDCISLVREAFMLEDGFTALNGMLISENIPKTSKKDSQKVVGYGDTTSRVTFDVNQELLTSAAALIPGTPFSELLSSLIFSGKQNLYFLVSEDNIIHKASYTGQLERNSGIWKVNAAWKMGSKNEMAKDYLKVNASKRVSDSEKKETTEWMISRETSDLQEKWTWQRIHMTGKRKTVHTVSGDIKWKDGHLTGLCELKESENTSGTNGSLLELKPDLVFSLADPSVMGTVDFLYTVDGMNPYSGTVSVELSKGGSFDFPLSENILHYDRLDAAERSVWSENIINSVYGALLRELVLIDSADTSYLRQGLQDSDWLSIQYAAGPVVEEE